MKKRVEAGVMGLWTDERHLLKAAKVLREKGYDKIEAITPFPVHGLEEALAIPRSGIPYVTFVAGVTGGGLGLLFQYWTSVISWPINVGGRPFFSGPAFIPITFELMILFAALGSVTAMFIVCGMPRFRVNVHDPDLTSHKFALFVSEYSQNYDKGRVSEALQSLGAESIKDIVEF